MTFTATTTDEQACAYPGCKRTYWEEVRQGKPWSYCELHRVARFKHRAYRERRRTRHAVGA